MVSLPQTDNIIEVNICPFIIDMCGGLKENGP